MLAGEFDGSLQERHSDARSPVTAVDGEARNPPDSVVIVGEHSGESLIAVALAFTDDNAAGGTTARVISWYNASRLTGVARDTADFAAPERRKSWHQHHEGSSPR